MTETMENGLVHLPASGSRIRFRKSLIPLFLLNHIFGIAGCLSVLAALYWVFLASDRYVSEAHVLVQRTDLVSTQGMDFSSLLGGVNGNKTDQLLLRDFLTSVDMLKKLETALKLKAHYSNPTHDLLSRMWLTAPSMEWFQRYYLTRVAVDYDDLAGVLIVKAEGYDAKTAFAITTLLMQEGDLFMNDMAHGLAQGQVDFLQNQLVQINVRAMRARQAVLDYQNKNGLVSPQGSVEAISIVLAKLEAQRTELETQRRAGMSYLMPTDPGMVLMSQQITAIGKQIAQEQAKVTSLNGKSLNRTAEEFQRLEMEAAFTQDVYKTALTALEKGRIEAVRTIKKLSVVQAPTFPESSQEPRRYYNAVVFALLAMLMAGVIHLIGAIVHDHKD